ncbi:hypothetical protein [Tsukamurella tyrosinosolvens]|uniref:hypothetical protein n=1 Tax=Tsukamurella tyrosinosolvens TaxID=57704 RepID=UPI002DD43F1D|nr:hypothetical protein [Tsukamurella tyrosinosolvens]MEC4614571.1 hypothetical protein [Tsukamurella tyrosinosolvens]
MTTTEAERTVIVGGWNAVGRKKLEQFFNDDRLPRWQRIAFYCWSHCRRDNHCPVPGGKLALLLGAEPRLVRREIKKAVDMGFLLDGSNENCLIMPGEMRYNAGNYVAKDCPHHQW